MDTTAPPVTPPFIFNLHDDLFLHIFHLNTYMPESEYSVQETRKEMSPLRPMNTTRYTSQVCRAWRQIILGSPAIWASLIDMTSLKAGSETWTEEVLKRTGNCDLSIYGRIGRDYQSQKRLTSLLTAHWHRVRKFEIVEDLRWAIKRTSWNIIFGQPAPKLEKFLVINGNNYFRAHPLTLGGRRVLFAGFAPSLRRYHCAQLDLDYGATEWQSQLLSFTLSFPSRDALSILSSTVRLESLIIRDIASIPDGDWTKISLPHLIRLDIQGTVSQCLFYLRNIVTHPHCALVISIRDVAEDISLDEFNLLVDIIKLYTVRFFNIEEPSRLSMSFSYLTFNFQTVKGTDIMYFAHPETKLDFCFDRRSAAPSAFLIDIPMSILSSISLGCIVELEYGGSVSAHLPGVVGLLTNLTSVQTLIMSLYNFPIVDKLQRISNTPILPLLTDLIVQCNTAVENTFQRITEDMLLFFRRRKEDGVPVLTLNITHLLILWGRYNWSFLDEIEGLKVVWKDSEEFEYICGSGGKDILNWNPPTEDW